ncbi:MAG: DUF4258 domain-containing protein [Tepidisphaeraceae bacterium]
MSETLRQVKLLIEAGKVQPSRHGYQELAKDRLFFDELVAGIVSAVVVEDYPTYAKGPCVLVLQTDACGDPAHVLWGIGAGTTAPAVLVTAYRPDPRRWDSSFLLRRSP